MRWLACVALFVAFYFCASAMESLVFFAMHGSGPDTWANASVAAALPGPVRFGAIGIIALIGFLLPATRRGLKSRRTAVALAVLVTIVVQAWYSPLAPFLTGGAIPFEGDYFYFTQAETLIPMGLSAVFDCFTATALIWMTVGVRAPAPVASGVRHVDLGATVRTLDRLNYWRAFYRSGFATWTVLPFLLALAYLVATYGFHWTNPGAPAWWAYVLPALLSAPFLIVLGALLVSFIPWRVVTLLVLATAGPTLVLMDPMIKNLAFDFQNYERALIVFWIVAAPLQLLIVALLTALAMADSSEFNIARGWRPRSAGARLRQAYGVPTYVSGAAPASLGITVLFVSASIFYAAWQILPVAIANSGSTYAALILHQLEGGASLGQVIFAMAIGGPLGLLMVGLVFGVLALIGMGLARRGRRAITERYQSALENDERPPALYLRAFNLDERKIRSRRHGILPRLVTAPGAPATLDEIILDRVSPYAPVVAIGRPSEPTPPFGAARIYVRGDDWQSVVRSLAEAGRLVILSLDETPGVKWEIDFLVSGEHADKAIFLTNPFAARDARWALVREVFPEIATLTKGRDVIGVVRREGVTTVLTAPHAGREAYGCAIGWHLQQLGLAR